LYEDAEPLSTHRIARVIAKTKWLFEVMSASQRRGHDDITLFVDLIKKRTVFIAEGKDHKTVASFADDLTAHHGRADAITDVRCDRSPAFINLRGGIAAHLPQAQITFDRFHMVKALHLREGFQERYKAPGPDAFEGMLKRWYFWATHSRIEPMIQAARTIKAHWEGVLAWKKRRISNGLLEGLNSLIQAAKAKAAVAFGRSAILGSSLF
jgi:transposase